MSSMKQRGSISVLLIPLIVAVLLLIAAIIFGAWAYEGREDYKNNVDKKIDAAVAVAKQQVSTAKDAQFVQDEKKPLKTYVGPAAYGSVTVKFPKTWSGYVADTSNTDPFVDGYFYPGTVPDTNDQSSVYALRVQVVQESYSDTLNDIQSYVEQGDAKVAPYTAPKVPSVVGSRITGQFDDSHSGTMVIFPLRDKTLKVWTESPQFENDFSQNILPNLIFSP